MYVLYVLYVFFFFPAAFYRANPERMPSLFLVFFPAYCTSPNPERMPSLFLFFFPAFYCANPERIPSVCPQQPLVFLLFFTCKPCENAFCLPPAEHHNALIKGPECRRHSYLDIHALFTLSFPYFVIDFGVLHRKEKFFFPLLAPYRLSGEPTGILDWAAD